MAIFCLEICHLPNQFGFKKLDNGLWTTYKWSKMDLKQREKRRGRARKDDVSNQLIS